MVAPVAVVDKSAAYCLGSSSSDVSGDWGISCMLCDEDAVNSYVDMPCCRSIICIFISCRGARYTLLARESGGRPENWRRMSVIKIKACAHSCIAETTGRRLTRRSYRE